MATEQFKLTPLETIPSYGLNYQYIQVHYNDNLKEGDILTNDTICLSVRSIDSRETKNGIIKYVSLAYLNHDVTRFISFDTLTTSNWHIL